MLVFLRNGLSRIAGRLVFADAEQSSGLPPAKPIEADEAKRLKSKAFWRKAWIPTVKFALITAAILTAAFRKDIIAFLNERAAHGQAVGAAESVAFFASWALVFFLAARIGFALYWKYWLDVRAKSNDSFVKVDALLHVAETYASFQNYATRCLFVSALGYLFLFDLVAAKDQSSPIALLMIFAVSTVLVILAVDFQVRGLGRIFIENLLFITVQAEAAPIANEDVFEDMETRLLPRFHRERPEHFF